MSLEYAGTQLKIEMGLAIVANVTSKGGNRYLFLRAMDEMLNNPIFQKRLNALETEIDLTLSYRINLSMPTGQHDPERPLTLEDLTASQRVMYRHLVWVMSTPPEDRDKVMLAWYSSVFDSNDLRVVLDIDSDTDSAEHAVYRGDTKVFSHMDLDQVLFFYIRLADTIPNLFNEV